MHRQYRERRKKSRKENITTQIVRNEKQERERERDWLRKLDGKETRRNIMKGNAGKKRSNQVVKKEEERRRKDKQNLERPWKKRNVRREIKQTREGNYKKKVRKHKKQKTEARLRNEMKERH